MLPTVAEVVGVRPPTDSDGISMLPTLLGKPQKQHRSLYWDYPEGSGSRALRMGKWKGLIQHTNKGNKSLLLYDLESDPREEHDLAQQYPDVVQQILKEMERQAR